jgi:SpoVK/Ycf46/Vps4 family AAA+-type ATPase
MAKLLHLESAKVAKNFRHDRVTDIHVLLAWVLNFEDLVLDNVEVIRVNLRERGKQLLDLGLVERSESPDLEITALARDYLTRIAGKTDDASLFLELLSQSDVSAEYISLSGEHADATANKPGQNRNLKASLKALDDMVGLKDVKEKVKKLVAVAEMAAEKVRKGQPAAEPGLNLVFSGDPGTGKTTVARIIGDVYRGLGLLSKGHVVEVSKQDLVGRYVGETDHKTSEVINKALGGVLFIDEAYSLSQEGAGGFGAEAIATLVKAMEDNRQDLAVIVAGYSEPMLQFIQSNDGLKSRFSDTLYFQNYSEKDLLTIFKNMASDHKVRVPNEVSTSLERHFSRNQTSGSNGNGRYVRKLFARMWENMSVRAMQDGEINTKEIDAFKESDVPSSLESQERKITLVDALAELDALVGLDNVKAKVRELIARVQMQIRLDAANRPTIPVSLNMLFTGDPGTGKTTVARIISKIYQAIGVLPRGHLVEVGRQDLIAEYIGQTAPKTQAKIDASMGGVLFIDEAYTLAPRSEKDFGPEAIATLIQSMENLRGYFSVIAAGYTMEMKAFVDANPGFKSRVDNEIVFPNYTKEELLEIFLRIASENQMGVDDSVREAVRSHLHSNETGGAAGNARYVRKLFEACYTNVALRGAENNYDIDVLSKFISSDVPPRLYENAKQQIGFQLNQ